MGLCNSPDIFHKKMNESFNGLDYVRAYIDDLLIISNGNFENHLNKVKIILKKLEVAGFKINSRRLINSLIYYVYHTVYNAYNYAAYINITGI